MNQAPKKNLFLKSKKPNYFNMSSIIEDNGNSIIVNNLNKCHSLKLGSLVEVSFTKSDFNGLRLFVVEHTRDCDGSPNYSLSFDKNIINKLTNLDTEDITDLMLKYSNALSKERLLGAISRGYAEDSLKLIESV